MTDIDITKMSSKGQIVIPSEMRADFKEGEKFVIIKSGKQLILKRTKDFAKKLKDDIIFAKRTDKALKRYEKGEFISMEASDFLKEIEK